MKTDEQHNKAGELFLAACDLSPEAQTSFLDENCSGNATLRVTVTELLQEDSRVELFLASCAGAQSQVSSSALPPRETGPTNANNGACAPLAPQNIRDFRASRPTVPGYEILSVLGHGGMGIVYRARQEKLNRAVALKVLPRVIGAAHPTIVERFRREAAAAAKLRHRNIVPIYDFGEAEDCYYYAMELIDGWSLREVISQLTAARAETSRPPRKKASVGSDADTAQDAVPALAPTELDRWFQGDQAPFGRDYFNRVAGWIGDVAEALHVAHGQGIVHRDVKPGNLMLARDGRIMITDFGLAATERDDTITRTGAVFGTLRYMSPEQALGDRVPVDHRTDIYSLGATLYELLTLSPIFKGEDGNQLLAAVIGNEPPSPIKLKPSVPADLDTICMHALAKLPENRYPTAAALAIDLGSFTKNQPITVRPPGMTQRAVSWARHHKLGILLAIVGLLIVGAGGLLTRNYHRAGVDREVGDLVSQGLVLQQDRRWTDAGEVYNAAIQLDPENTRALGNLAIVLKEQFNEASEPDPSLLVDAEYYCNAALKVAPDHAGLWNLKGVILKKLGRYDDALMAYEESLAIPSAAPDMVIAAHNNLAEVYWLWGDRDNAERHVRRAAQVADETDTPAWFAWQDLAALELSYENPVAADYIQRGFDSTHEPHWRLHVTRARVHLEIKGVYDIEQAVRDAYAALELGPPDPRIERIVALAMLRSGDDVGCLRHAQEALALGDIPAFPYMLMAIAEAHRGNAEGAEVNLDAARESWPQDLINAGYVVSTQRGMLWLDTADQLERLLEEGESLLNERP